MTRRASLLALAVAIASPLAGCGGDPPRAPNTLRPIDEPHAVQIMARVFREFDLQPERNRLIKFGASDTELKIDISAKDHKYGIAYITWQDAEKLGDALPKRRDPDSIIVVRGNGDDSETHAVLLFAADYMQDDLAGESHTSTSIAAEKKLELATRDVLRKADHESWP